MIGRITIFAPLVFALATSAIAAERRVVFAVVEPEFSPVKGDAKLYMEPIAWARPLAPPPRGVSEIDPPPTESREFVRRYFARTRSYTTYTNGRRGGVVHPLEQVVGGCASLGATAAGSRIAAPTFAVNFDVAERELRDRRPSPAEAAALFAYGKRWYATRGFEDAQLELVASDLIDVAEGEEPLLAGTIAVRTVKAAAECPPPSLFVLARTSEVSATRVVPQLIIAPGGACDTGLGASLFGHVDFDGDGIDEIVLRDDWIEAYQYLVIARDSSGKWRIAVRGGVAGC